ncbi:MAG: hypothetical protein NC115_05940 [Bacteroidales bacterium]|nr:hypothetical protein [Bacteroidales bacterium]
MITSYKELPIGKYQRIMELCRDESIPQFDMQMSVFAILSDIPEEELLDMPIAEFKEIASKATFLEMDMPEMNGRKAASIYRLGKWELVPSLDIRKITTAQYVDFQTFCREDSRTAKMLSCFLIPKGCRYNDGYDITQVHKAIEDNMSIYDAAELSAFFLRKSLRSIKDILTSSMQGMKTLPEKTRTEMMESMMKAKKDFISVGDGLRTSMLFPNWYAVRGVLSGK